MKRYIKHYIGPAIFLLILAGTILFVTSVQFGVLALDLLERVSGVKIEYQDMTGNIWSGFRIGRYCVRLSETDSICGTLADIHYRLNPFMLRLPNLFEVNLIEPTITIGEKKMTGGEDFHGFPDLRLGLRVNLKNGQIIYRSNKLYKIDRISGIVFLDLVGSRTRVAAMNLSFQSAEQSVYMTSMTLDAEIDNEQIRLNKFKAAGDGFMLEANGRYTYQPRNVVLNFSKGQVDLKKINVAEGMVDFTGSITYAQNNLLPELRGSVVGLRPLDRFRFETNAAADTIWVNVFDGEVLGGLLSAQLRVTQRKDLEFAMNFKDADVSGFLGTELPARVSGYLSYADEHFVGRISSPSDSGLGLDSLDFFGTYAGSLLRLDSLFVTDGKRTLRANGVILPELDLQLDFADFDLSRFQKYMSTGGQISGSIQVVGSPSDPLNLSFTSKLHAHDISLRGFFAESLQISSRSFQKDRQARSLSVTIRGLRFKDYDFGRTDFHVSDSLFSFVASREEDSIVIKGILRDNLQGTIDSFLLDRNQVFIRSARSVEFDILRRTFSNIDLVFADGSLGFSSEPSIFEMSAIDLHELGRLLGLKEDLSGVLDLKMENDTIRINARNIYLLGLQNGTLTFRGHYVGESIIVDSLSIYDDTGQACDARGVLSLQHSELTAKFHDVGVWVLVFLKKFLVNPTGLMTGEVVFKGNLEQFQFSGGGRIHNGSFAVAIIAAQLDSVETDVVFDGDKILFVSGKGLLSPMNGRTSSAQWISGGGVVKLEERFSVDNLNFDFGFVDAPIQYPPFAYGIGSGNFSLSMRDRIMYYNGIIAVKEGVVPLEFGTKIKEEEAVQDDNWRLYLRLTAERNVWLRNRDADIEFGGELVITREQGPVNLSGIMETDRGNYYWLNHILSITQGKVTFIPGGEIDPDLDFWAELGTREGVKIILHLFGSISEPIFEFYTDPPGQYTEQDIMTYLNLNITWQELEQLKRGEYVSKIIPHSLVSWLEGDVARAIRQYTGLDYFHIETPLFEEGEKTKLTVGKFIARNLFVTYTYDITTFSNEFNVEYYINDRNKIHVERDDTGEYNLQYQYRLRF
jgi:hypothetical protein